MAGERHAVERACRIAGSPTAATTYRDSGRRLNEPSRHAWLLDQIIKVHPASRGTYGVRRVHAELTLGREVRVGHNAVEMLMSRAQIYSLPGPKRRKKVPAPSTRHIRAVTDRGVPQGFQATISVPASLVTSRRESAIIMRPMWLKSRR